MAGEDARLKAGLKSAEDELNLIKNQIQQTLLDIREHILDVTNPFNTIAPEHLDDDEDAVSIEDAGGDMGGGDVVDGGGGDEIIEEGGDADIAEDLEALDDGEGILGDDGMLGDEYEDVPGGEMYGDGAGGGGGGGLAEMMAGDEEDELDEEEEEGFELDDEEDEESPEDMFSPDLEEEAEEDHMDQPLPKDEYDEPVSSGDGVADAVAAALVANVDLLTMASLVRWTAVTRERIGANRLDILLDAYEMAGRITPQMRNVIRTLSALGDEDADGIPVRDIVTAMVRMEGVLNSDQNRSSNRLLGLLLEMDDDPLDRLVA